MVDFEGLSSTRGNQIRPEHMSSGHFCRVGPSIASVFNYREIPFVDYVLHWPGTAALGCVALGCVNVRLCWCVVYAGWGHRSGVLKEREGVGVYLSIAGQKRGVHGRGTNSLGSNLIVSICGRHSDQSGNLGAVRIVTFDNLIANPNEREILDFATLIRVTHPALDTLISKLIGNWA